MHFIEFEFSKVSFDTLCNAKQFPNNYSCIKHKETLKRHIQWHFNNLPYDLYIGNTLKCNRSGSHCAHIAHRNRADQITAPVCTCNFPRFSIRELIGCSR